MGEELLCRKEQAERQRQQEEEEEAPDHDDELLRMQLLENQKAIAEFERRDQIFIQQLQIRKEQQQRRLQNQEGHGSNEDDDCQYVEEGRSKVIFKGNGILYNKKKTALEDPNRPTSNHTVSAQQLLDDVAPQVPNFGTEQDKDHCPFHLKTGACRFGPRCSRVHFYPDKSCTLLMKNLYNGPGLAWEQDEGLEQTDEEVERCYEEFYEDVHTEFLKFGVIINFKVCRNSSSHLRGNVYVQYKSLDSAMVANQSINRRYFAGKQVTCEFINVTKWKVAICGEFMKSKLKTCSRGTACNFIHCFRNPGGDYEWADWDKPPPGYWIRKLDALFGYTDETAYERQVEDGNFVPLWDTVRYHSKRFHSKDYAESSNRNSRTHYQEENAHDTHRSARSRKQSRKDRNLRDFHHDKYDGEETSGMDHPGRIDKFCASDPDKYWSERDADANWYDDNTRRRLRCPEGKRKSRDNEDDHKKGRHRDYYSRKRSREQVDDHKDSKISVEHSISSQEQSRQSSKRPSEEVDDHKESKISDDDAGGMT